MTKYKYQGEVRQRAEEYLTALKVAGFSAQLLENSFRDYTVKLAVEKAGQVLGNVNIYYSPKQAQYTLKTHELKSQDFADELSKVWTGEISVQDSIPAGICAYVDGSFSGGKIGYGAVILRNGQIAEEFSGGIDDATDHLSSMNQVGGEIEAVYKVLDWAKENNIPAIDIYFDYQGLESWANGTYKANNAFTRKYQEFIRNTPVKITWHKVEGHSGDRWNDRADALAKKGIQQISINDPDELLKELEEYTEVFVTFLQQNGIQAHFERIYNMQHSRIIIYGGQGRNVLDVYNTKKSHLDPKWHGFFDQNLKDKVRSLWSLRNSGGPVYKADKGVDERVSTIGQYIERLRPYRHLAFDFLAVARSIEQLGKEHAIPTLNADEMRFDFDLLEKNYKQLLGEHHGQHQHVKADRK